MTEIVGVIPAAGYAKRLQPLACSKEVLPVKGRPVIAHLVERMRMGGSTRLRVVTRVEKRDVIEFCRRTGVEVVLAEPATVTASIAAALSDLASEDVVLIGFPDTLWEPAHGFHPLVESVRAGADAALGLFRIRESDLSRSDVVVTDASRRVRRVHVKPAHPSSSLIWGCAAVRNRSLEGLEHEAWPGAHFDRLCLGGADVRGFVLSDEWLDIGTKPALDEVRG